MSETSSVNSGSSQRLLQLSLKGEWIALEQTIKGLDKGDPELTVIDEVKWLWLFFNLNCFFYRFIIMMYDM